MNAPQAQTEPSRPGTLLLIAATAIVGGAIIGGTTNAINGVVSPIYFRNIMRWHRVEDIWSASIAQGIFEGLIYGLFFSLVFTLVVGIVTRARCPYVFALRHLVFMIGVVYCCWAAGGLLAMGLASLSPEFYRNAFFQVPDEWIPMLGYAWVGGSIWGGMLGGLLAVVVGSVVFTVNWKQTATPEST